MFSGLISRKRNMTWATIPTVIFDRKDCSRSFVVGMRLFQKQMTTSQKRYNLETYSQWMTIMTICFPVICIFFGNVISETLQCSFVKRFRIVTYDLQTLFWVGQSSNKWSSNVVNLNGGVECSWGVNKATIFDQYIFIYRKRQKMRTVTMEH